MDNFKNITQDTKCTNDWQKKLLISCRNQTTYFIHAKGFFSLVMYSARLEFWMVESSSLHFISIHSWMELGEGEKQHTRENSRHNWRHYHPHEIGSWFLLSILNYFFFIHFSIHSLYPIFKSEFFFAYTIQLIFCNVFLFLFPE